MPPSAVFHAKLRPAVNPEYVVARPRLHALLDDAVGCPLTLVVAPAGSGKTSLLRTWAAQTTTPLAWFSVDETDRDPVQLWIGVLAALDGIAPGCAAAPSRQLRRPEHLLGAVGMLLDDLEERSYEPRVLVVDDLQLVDEEETVATSLAVFVQHLPAWLRVVVASRRTPRLPVHRLRARGQLGEVHFPELRFSFDEAESLLERIAPTLTPDRVAEVAARAGGWAASIQLAALAARSSLAQPVADRGATDDVAVYLEDYVWQEVLASESDEVVDVLLATAVVDRIDPRLAQVLAERDDAPELLARAEGRGLFVTRIEPFGAFEVHALVRSVLVALAERRSPGRSRELHARAARWFEEQGEAPAALEEWLRADQPRQALRLLAAEAADLYDTGREGTILRTIAAIPPGVAASDLPTMVEFAWGHLLVDRQRFLQAVDYAASWAEQEPATSVADLARVRVLSSIAATIRGDWGEGARAAREALQDLGAAWILDPLGRFGWNMRAREIALAERWDDAGPDVRAVMQALSVAPERRIAVEGTRALGEALAGRPVDTLRLVAGAREAAEIGNMTILRTELAIAEAIALREIGDGAALPALLELAEVAVEPVPYATLLAQLELVRARIEDGDLDAAEQAFGRATALVETELTGQGARDWLARTGTVLALAAGAADDAGGWAGQVVDSFWSGVGFARILIATGEPAAACDALKGAEPRCPRHQVVRDLLLSRVVADAGAADRHLVTAVQVAARHGLVQTVAAQGPEIVESIERLAWQAPQTWLDRLRRAAVPAGVASTTSTVALIESLTERELEVLRLLPSRLTLREIADELFISVNTLKFHLKVVYRKLDCGSRAEAAEMARVLTSLRRGAVQPSSTRRR